VGLGTRPCNVDATFVCGRCDAHARCWVKLWEVCEHGWGLLAELASGNGRCGVTSRFSSNIIRGRHLSLYRARPPAQHVAEACTDISDAACVRDSTADLASDARPRRAGCSPMVGAPHSVANGDEQRAHLEEQLGHTKKQTD
jgi:hypothetical protein